jgi:hypothetical protein
MTVAVWVAMFAVVSSTVSSIVALVLSGRNLRLAQKGYDRTGDRKDKLRDALIDVSMAVHAYGQVLAWYGKLLTDLTDPRSAVDVGTVNQYDVDRLRPAAGEVYRAILVAEFLTTDERLTEITDIIKQSLVSATKTVNNFRATIPGMLGAVKELKGVRSRVGDLDGARIIHQRHLPQRGLPTSDQGRGRTTSAVAT